MSKPQVIRDDSGQPAFAVISWDEFERLVGDSAAEAILSDEELFDLAKAANEESFPAEVVDQLLAGKHPIAVFCRYRGIRQRHLAREVGIHPNYLSQIVHGRRTGSVDKLMAIARVLNVDLDDLVTHNA